jgi:hypothetical protein
MRWLGLSLGSSVPALLAGLVLGCGGVAASDLTSGSGDSDGGSTPDAHDAATRTGTGTPESGAADAPGVVILETGTPTQEAAPPVDTNPGLPETGPKPHMISFACPTGGSNKCMGDAPIACCVTQGLNIGGAPTGTCEIPADPSACQGPGKAEVTCASSLDCAAGKVCCGQKNGQDQYITVSCQTSCDAAGTTHLCTDHPSDCDSDQDCDKSTILPPYDICVDK